MADFTGREVDRVSVRVLPNLRRFLPDLQKYLKRIETQVRVEIPTSLDTTGLEAEANRAARAVEQSTEINIPVDADTGAAEAQIARATRPRTVPVNVDVDSSSLRLLTSGLDSAVSAVGSIGKFGGIGLLGGGGIVAVSGLTIAATQAAGAVGVLAAAMGAAAGAAGILGAAIAGQVIQMAAQQQDIKTASDALAKLEPGTKDYRDKLAELTALQRTFNQQFGPAATALDNLKDSWQGFLNATRTNTLSLMAGAMDTLSDVLPKLAPAANAAAGAVEGLVDQFARWTQSTGFTVLLRWIETNGIKTITRLATAFGSLALAFGPVIAAFTPFANDMMRGLVGMSRDFRAFIDEADRSGALQDFAETSVNAFKTLAGLLADVGGSLISIGKAAAGAAGGGLLGGLSSVFDRLNTFLNSPAAQSAMKAFFTGVNSGFHALGQALGPVGQALGNVLPALGSILGSVGRGIGAVLEAVATPLAILAGPLAEVAAVMAEGLTRGLEALGPGLKVLAAGLGTGLVDLVRGIAPHLPQLARVITRLGLAIANTLAPALPSLVRALLALVPVAPPLLRALANLLPVVTPLLRAMLGIIAAAAPQVAAFARRLAPIGKAIGDLAGPARQVIDAISPWIAKFQRVDATVRGGFFKLVGTLLVGALKGVGTQLRIIGNLLSGDFKGAFNVARDAAKELWGWLDDLNNKLHEWMVKLDSMPGIEIPGIGDDEHKRTPLGPRDTTAPHGPSAPQFNFNVRAHDYDDFRRQVARRVRHANAGGVAFAP